jgi:hypothetical protein
MQQSIVNSQDGPIYVSVEPWPECFELEPKDKLTLIFDAPETGDAILMHFVNDRELVVSPEWVNGDVTMLNNGESAEGRSWKFKHR